MARVECEECGQEIGTDLFPCPHCGKPATFNFGTPKSRLYLSVLLALSKAVMVFLFLNAASGLRESLAGPTPAMETE